MGTNDHMSNKSQRTARRGRQVPKELLYWTEERVNLVAKFAAELSAAGGYLGLGRNSSGDCLLLYVKLDTWSERIAIESADQLVPTLDDLIAELES
jgi:hypothetical protein